VSPSGGRLVGNGHGSGALVAPSSGCVWASSASLCFQINHPIAATAIAVFIGAKW